MRNLAAEGYEALGRRIARVGEVMLGAALFYCSRARPPANFPLEPGGRRFALPVGYLEMVWLLHTSSLVVTGSGGLQKEA